jgi:uncharacterized membrane protein YphA (DoxX/SURF4 family)
MNTECRQQNISCNDDTNWRWLIIRFVIAAILLTAAFFKAYDLTTPSLGEGLLHARWFKIFVVDFVVEFELILGVWLIFGLLPKLTWLVVIGLFSIFSVVSFYEAIQGSSSCGCFGEKVTINPGMMALSDLVITGLLLIFLPKKNIFCPKILLGELTALRHKGRIIAVIVIWLVVTVPMMFAMLSVSFVTLTEESPLLENEKSVLLEPSKWIGKKFPLLQFLEHTDVDKISTNDQNIVLFRFDCEECKQLVEKIQDKNHYIFIAIPSEKNNVALFSLSEYSTLPDKYEWWIETPIVLTLENGIVKKVFKMIE